MRKTVQGREIRRTLALAAWSALLAGLALTVLLRGYELVSSGSVPRSGIGEVRWFHLATRPHSEAVELVMGLPESALKQVVFPGDFEPMERVWFVNVLRYSCPASDVQVALATQGAVTPLTLLIQPACVLELPEFLASKDGSVNPGLLGVLSWMAALVAFGWIGRCLLASARNGPAGDAWTALVRVCVEVCVGWAFATLLSGLMVACGLRAIYGLPWAAAVALGVHLLDRGSRGPRAPSKQKMWPLPSPAWSRLELSFALIAFTVGGLVLARAWRQPLWSWDHHAIWGFKARQLATGASHFLSQPGYEGSAPDYPLGLPLAWLLGCLGRLPGSWDFHVAWSISMVLSAILLARLFHQIPRVWMWSALALGLGSPLYWDLEGVGLAELPLAVWSLAALVCAGSSRRRAWLGVAICLAMITFIKNEGVVLALALVPAVWALSWGRGETLRHRSIKKLLWAAVLGVVAVRLGTALQTETNTSFFRSGGLERFQNRLLTPLEIFVPVLDQLDHPSWMGLWLLVPVGLTLIAWVALSWVVRHGRRPASGSAFGSNGGARRLRAGIALFLGAMIVLVVYLMVYFATPEDVTMHVWTSWHRIIAPILLWILVAVCWLFGGQDLGHKQSRG